MLANRNVGTFLSLQKNVATIYIALVKPYMGGKFFTSAVVFRLTSNVMVFSAWCEAAVTKPRRPQHPVPIVW